jgi:hypothetical protein
MSIIDVPFLKISEPLKLFPLICLYGTTSVAYLNFSYTTETLMIYILHKLH